MLLNITFTDRLSDIANMPPPAMPRTAMRLLSPRIHHLQRVQQSQLSKTSVRLASSRYSSPSKRAFTVVSAQSPSFVDSALNSDNVAAHLQQEAARNPLDARAVQMAHEEKQQYHLRRMRFAGMGLLLSIFGMAALIYNLDLDDIEQAEAKRKQGKQQLDASNETSASFQGKEVHVIGAGDGKRIVAQGNGMEIELVETGTSSVPHFPRTINLPTSSVPVPGSQEKEEQYTLLGLGIRTVSFLSIQVYVVGMYIRTTDLSALQEKLIHSVNESASTLIPSEKEELKKKLLDPQASREIWTELLKTPGMKTAWRISPTRNTDYGHLRDGWVTGISNRTREFKQIANGAETEFEAEEFGKSIGEFKAVFQGGKAPKGSVMILARDVDGSMDVLFQEKPASSSDEKPMEKLGSIKDERISKLIWLTYLTGDKVSSEPARKSIVEGSVEFAGRPVGSAETMIR